jgi:hypothetical protein
MWELKEPEPVKLIIGILAADRRCLETAVEAVGGRFGKIDLQSEAWPFTQTGYYKEQTGGNILRQFVSLEDLIGPGELADVKHGTNGLEQELAVRLSAELPRPVNLDPGIIEPSKLVLATTKNYSHRIYIGKQMYAELTLIYDKGGWQSLPYTYPDYKLASYQDFFSKARIKLLEQLKSKS